MVITAEGKGICHTETVLIGQVGLSQNQIKILCFSFNLDGSRTDVSGQKQKTIQPDNRDHLTKNFDTFFGALGYVFIGFSLGSPIPVERLGGKKIIHGSVIGSQDCIPLGTQVQLY